MSGDLVTLDGCRIDRREYGIIVDRQGPENGTGGVSTPKGAHMAITSDNLNLNLNLNLGATAAANSTLGYGGPRYNTEDFPKLNPPNTPANIALPTSYSPDWDPELRTWAYI